jgi:hypothetical protein
MHNNIAIEFLKTLNKDELKKFEQFLKSPFFNSNKTLVTLFETIKKFAPDYTDKTLLRDNLFKKIYPGKKYNELSLRTRMSELAELLRKFFAITRFEKDEFSVKLNTIEELNDRAKYKISEKYILEMLKENNESKDTGVPVNYQKVQLEKALLYIKRDETGDDGHPEHLIKLGDALLNYFFGYMFKIVNNMYYNEDVFKYKPDFNIIKIFLFHFNNEKFLEELERNNYANYPHLAIYYYMYMSRLDKYNDTYFYKMRELVYKHHDKFDIIGKTNLWGFLINAVTIGLQFENKKYIKELFEVNKFFVNLNIMPLRKGEYFLNLLFDNIFIIALTSGEIEYAEYFLNEHGHELNPEIRDNYLVLCRSILALYKRNYEESLSLLSKIQLTDSIMKLRVRMLYFMNYYETNAFESAASLLDSFKHFLTENKKLPEYLIEGIKATVKYSTKILNAKMNNKKLDYAVYKEAKEIKIVYSNREWIIEKMEELL